MSGSGEREETTHRGVRWRRDDSGVSFYDADGDRWVRWGPKVDAPPLPPSWKVLGVPSRVTRPGRLTPWRVVPVVLVGGATIVAIWQATASSPNNTAKEAAASAALVGHCLAKSGGHFTSATVPCDSSKAAVKVVSVVPTEPPTACPAGTVGVEFVMAGVSHPHVECVAPLGAG
jgi:hypothetical protein